MSTTTTRLDEGEPTIPAYGRIDDLDLKATVAQALDRWPSAGLAVAVVRDGALAWFHGHGLADIAGQVPITEDTVFRIGSITKIFTAIAVMQLWEQGLVDLDAPANDYLHSFRLVPMKPNMRPATLRHLLTHTAGVGYWRRLSDLLQPGVGSGVPRDDQGCSPLRTTTAGACQWRSSRERSGCTATTGLPRSDRLSRTSAASGWIAIYATASSTPWAWSTPTSSDRNGSSPIWLPGMYCALAGSSRSLTGRSRPREGVVCTPRRRTSLAGSPLC
jgi:hypothetical protein